MKIEKILNNNVVIIIEDKKEKIVCGRGIAFKKKIGDLIDQHLINKTFILNDEKNNYLKELLADIPLEYIEIASEIIDVANMMLGYKLNNNILISLSDHIYNAVSRFKEGTTVSNVLLLDIKQFYELEYDIGQKALNIIFNKTSIFLPDDEASFIALHIINAENENNSIEQTKQIIEITQEICSIVKYFFLVDYNIDSAYYYRFITHLKFFAKRMIMNQHINENFDVDLYNIIKNNYAVSFQCVERIAEFLENKYDYTMYEEEKLYLTIHIERIIYKVKNG